MIMGFSSSAKHSKDSAISLRSSVSSMTYYPVANGLVEAFNKTIEKLLKKFILKSQRDWDDKLGEYLWAYRITVRTPTKTIPFSLVHGCEAVLPLEIQIQSLHIALTKEMTNEESIDCDSRSWKHWTINACKLNSKSSFIKPEFLELSTRKSKSELSRKMTLS